MDLVQIRYFLSLASTLNFTRAAEQCNVTQPALTRSIQRLEYELGGALILRERKLTQLTELGRAMLPLLERTYEAAETVRAEAENRRRRNASPLRVGLCSLVTAAALVPVLRELAARFAELELTIAHATTAQLCDMLLQGELDAALVPDSELDAERLNRWPLFDDSLVVLVPPGHRFAQLASVPVSALHEETVLVHTDEGCSLRRALDRLCGEAAGIRPRLRHRSSSQESLTHMVSAGLGIALTTARQPATEGVVPRPLEADADSPVRQRIMLAAVAGRPAGRAADAFVKLARARDWKAA